MQTVKTIAAINDDALPRPDREEAERAVAALLRYIGEDPAREGLMETPARVVRAFAEHFAGYAQDASTILGKTFDEIKGYDDFVLVKNIEFVSHCEHHMAPVIGRAHVAYWPDQRVVGISKLARIVDMYARRLNTQEVMTRQIVESIQDILQPKGVVVMIDAVHHCMASRGALKNESSTVTSMATGVFLDDPALRARFISSCA